MDANELREWATLNLYDAVMAVRAGLDGSADPMDPAEARAILDVLRERLATWRPSIFDDADRQGADAHLRAFVESAARECERRLEEGA